MYLVEALSKLEKTFVTECWDDFETAGEDGRANSLNRSLILGPELLQAQARSRVDCLQHAQVQPQEAQVWRHHLTPCQEA